MIPLVHDLSGETVLVLGGGSVGARRARRFAREADVIVVSPAFPATAEGSRPYGGAELVRAAPEPDAGAIGAWLDRTGAVLVVAATDDPAVNAAAAAAARERGVLVNRADATGDRERTAGDIAVPATVEDGPVTVSVSTGGRSPALSGELRRRVDGQIEGAGELAALTGELRTALRDADVPAERRRAAVRGAVRSDAVWKSLRAPGGNTRDELMDVVAAQLDWPRDRVASLFAGGEAPRAGADSR